MKKRIQKKVAKRKPGRPAGSISKLTSSENDEIRNRELTRWGELAGRAGVKLARSEWLWRHQPIQLCAIPTKATPEESELIRARRIEEIRAAPLDEKTQTEIKRALYERDWQFFMDIADCLRLINPDGSVIEADPRERALLNYVRDAELNDIEFKRSIGRTPKPLVFGITELIQRVPWGRDKWGSLTPSERDLRRMCDRLNIPRRQGRPPKK